MHTTRVFGLESPAAPLLEPGGGLGGTLSVNHRRVAEAVGTLEAISAHPLLLGARPVVNVRHFPRLSAGLHDKPAVHELVPLRAVRR